VYEQIRDSLKVALEEVLMRQPGYREATEPRAAIASPAASSAW
jgi:hypothetical protein